MKTMDQTYLAMVDVMCRIGARVPTTLAETNIAMLCAYSYVCQRINIMYILEVCTFSEKHTTRPPWGYCTYFRG